MVLANFFYETKTQNLTVQEEFNKLSPQEAAALISAFEKFFVNTSKNSNTSTNTNSTSNTTVFLDNLLILQIYKFQQKKQFEKLYIDLIYCISTKGEQPTEKPDELPFPKSNNNNEDPIYMYMVFALMFFMLIAILFLLRRYLIQQKLISFQMNEESNVQGFQA